MAGVSRGRIVSAIITSAVLMGLVAGVIVFVSQQDSQRALRSAAQARAAATPTDSVTTQFTPAPGITVTVSATPTHGASSSSSSSSTTSYTGGSNGGGVTYIVPPRYPTPIPTSSASAGGGASPSPTPTTGGGAGGVSPNPTTTPVGGVTPLPTPIPATPTATATPGPALLDDAQLLSQSPTSISVTNSWVTVSATMLNTGASTWSSTKGYALKCIQMCWSGWYTSSGSFSTPPGASQTFTSYMSPTRAYYYSVGQSIWQLYNPAVGYFGQQVVIQVVNHGWNLDFQEASPSCMGDGSVWTTQGSTGTVSCGSSSLVMAGGSPNGLGLELQSTPASYDPGNYVEKVHVHFTSTSASTFAGIIVTEPVAPQWSRMVFILSPAGYACYDNNTQHCLPNWPVQSITPSSDYDIMVSVYNNGMADEMTGGTFAANGGIYAGGLTGLIEVTGSGSSDAAYFSNYQLYQYK